MKRRPLPIWDRQGKLLFRPDRHYKKQAPLRASLPVRSTYHSKKTVRHGPACKKI